MNPDECAGEGERANLILRCVKKWNSSILIRPEFCVKCRNQSKAYAVNWFKRGDVLTTVEMKT